MIKTDADSITKFKQNINKLRAALSSAITVFPAVIYTKQTTLMIYKHHAPCKYHLCIHYFFGQGIGKKFLVRVDNY